MSTINGIGTKLLGFSQPDTEGRFFVTKWIVFLYLPLFPLSRLCIHMSRGTSSFAGFRRDFEIFSKGSPIFSEILRTYCYGWILIPFFLFAPLLFSIPEVSGAFGVRLEYGGFNKMSSGDYLFWSALLWLLVVVWKLKDWDERRGLVHCFFERKERSYKEEVRK